LQLPDSIDIIQYINEFYLRERRKMLNKFIAFFSCVFLLLLLNASFVQAASIVPSIEITDGVSDVCSNTSMSLPVFWNVTDSSSDSSVMSVQGVGTVFTWAENDFASWNGPSTYGVTPVPYNVPPGTPVTITITTYNGQNQTGGISYISSIVFACDTGNIISLQSGPPNGIPTITEWGMIIFIVFAGFGAAYYMRRQKRAER
jgi:hypothetical protein